MSNRINANEIVSVLTEEINRYRDKIEPKEVWPGLKTIQRHVTKFRKTQNHTPKA